MAGTWMFLLHLITAKVLNEKREDQNIEGNTLTGNAYYAAKAGKEMKKKNIYYSRHRVPKGVDRGFIMSYKAICDNCDGNGYINITDSKGVTESKQCWIM